jgi:hypothetical protein
MRSETRPRVRGNRGPAVSARPSTIDPGGGEGSVIAGVAPRMHWPEVGERVRSAVAKPDDVVNLDGIRSDDRRAADAAEQRAAAAQDQRRGYRSVGPRRWGAHPRCDPELCQDRPRSDGARASGAQCGSARCACPARSSRALCTRHYQVRAGPSDRHAGRSRGSRIRSAHGSSSRRSSTRGRPRAGTS